jgi:ABC-type branched-subunit amino acid transport system ATPase component
MDFSFFEATKARLQYLDGVYQNKKDTLTKLQETVKNLEKRDLVLSKTEEVLKFLINKLVKEDLSKMDKLITYGLNTVFPNKDLSFCSSIEEHGSRIKINLQTVDQGKIADSQCYSSISVVESLLLRIICIVKMKKARLLLMDETFDAIDSEYIDNVGKLMEQLSKKLKIDALLVTHENDFANKLHNMYKFISVNNSLAIEKVGA